VKNYVTLKIGKFSCGRTRRSLCLRSLYDLPETSTNECSNLEKEDIDFVILLHSKEVGGQYD